MRSDQLLADYFKISGLYYKYTYTSACIAVIFALSRMIPRISYQYNEIKLQYWLFKCTIPMYVLMNVCVYIERETIELDSTRSKYYACDPTNHLNGYWISLEFQSYYSCLKLCTSLTVLVNHSQSIHHLAGKTLITELQKIKFNRILNRFGTKLKTQIWIPTALGKLC